MRSRERRRRPILADVTGRRSDLVLLEGANAVGGVSNSLLLVVVPWLVLERTGSAAAAGLAAALAGLPGIVVAPLVGAVIDRLGRKAVSVVSDLLSAMSVAMFPVLDALDRLDLAAILVLTVLGAAFDPAGYTARKALIPDISRASGVGRDHVNGIHEGIFAAGWVVGPMLGAFAIATLGAVDAMWLAFVAFLLAAGTVAFLRVPNRAPSDQRDGLDEANVWAFARVGLRVLLADRPVWLLTVAIAVISLIYLPTESVLLPVHFEATGQPTAYGLVLSALAAGGMIGAFGYGWLAARMSRYRIATVFMTLACLSYAPLALLPAPVVMLVPAFLLGLAWGPMEPLLNSLVQDRFLPSQHGRVFGVQLALFYAAPPAGQVLAGVGVEALGVGAVFGIVAGGLVLMAVVVNVVPMLRGLDSAGDLARAGYRCW